LVTGPGAETSFTYAPKGNRLSTPNALGYSTAYQYDALDRVIASVDPISGETGRDYDHEGRTLAISDPLGHLTHFEFDGLGNRLRKDSPDSGVTLWEHDAAGNPTAAIDARGVRTEYVYDALGRLLSIATPDESLNVQFSYDAGPHGIGRLTGMVDAWGQVQFEYDAGGKLMTEVRVIDGETYITAHEYDPAGQRVRTVYPSGMAIDFERDAAGRVTAISRAGDESAEVLVSGIEYLPFGPVAQFQFGNGLSYAAQHGLDGRVQQLQSGGLHWGLAHDLAGNLVSISDQGGGLGDQVFAYDALDRIVSAQGPYGLQVFEYDGNGNRSRLLHDALDEVYSYELDSNRIVSRSDRTYEHDLRGNRRQELNAGGQDYLYRYDDHNRFRELVLQSPGGDEILAEYRYDGLGRRIAKSTDQGTVHFTRDASGRLLGEYEPGANGRSREYVYLEGQPIAVIDRTTAWNTPLGEELILDNGDPGTSFTGSWRQRSSSQAYGRDYLYASKASDRSYRWAAVPPGDTYRVYGRWVAKKSHSAAVHYTIRHGTGETETLTRSQKAGGGQWQLLGTYTRGDGQDYVEVRSDAGKFVADAVRWEELRPPIPTVIESTHFVHFDHLGTPRLVTDSDQSAVWSWSSTPDGTSGPNEDPDGDGESFVLNLRFPGQYYDAESGLHYNLFRDYDPATGRYLQSDPAGLVDGTNTYRYARNSPMNLIDPLGLWVKRCSRKLGGPTEPPVRPDSHNPFRHDFLVVSGVIYSFQSGGDNWWDILLSQGRIDSNEFENELCVSVCDDDRFDAFVHDAVNEVGAPSYCVGAFPGTPEHKAGARNCQTWANEVIDVARRNYLEANRNGCPNCFTD
ncbi:MAG: hypothetical protein KJO33_14320, partial [Gammaproteobacteria bacterium]|nr:hypothetical protein [Gammaproteobacteria bacterium]